MVVVLDSDSGFAAGFLVRLAGERDLDLLRVRAVAAGRRQAALVPGLAEVRSAGRKSTGHTVVVVVIRESENLRVLAAFLPRVALF